MMEVINNQIVADQVAVDAQPFIVANTKEVSLEHLKQDCIIPVFSKDNETTISHYEFIDKALQMTRELFPETDIAEPQIRVSHMIKGRTPDAIGLPKEMLTEKQKTIYYERCAFIINVPSIEVDINGNRHSLSLGGVRAYNQENLYSKKTLEKFKLFIGFRNHVCTNLCVSTDGFLSNVRIGSIAELEEHLISMVSSWNKDDHIEFMRSMTDYHLSEEKFAHLIGKLRMYQHLDKQAKKDLFEVKFSDVQINNVVRSYYSDDNFGPSDDGALSLYQLYNLFTGANKSSYIDSFLERSSCAYALISELVVSLQEDKENWFLYKK